MARQVPMTQLRYQRGKADVLVVDDHREIAELVAEILTDEGYTVRTAANGAEGLREILARQPDVLLLDIAMPIMTGDRLLMKLPSIGAQNLRVIIMTADTAPERFRDLGYFGILRKPFDLMDLLESVEACLL
jgi:CheY-like chemotaxis protein